MKATAFSSDNGIHGSVVAAMWPWLASEASAFSEGDSDSGSDDAPSASAAPVAERFAKAAPPWAPPGVARDVAP